MQRLRNLAGGTFPAELQDAFAEDVAEGNRRRLAALLPLMAAVHLLHVVFFRTSSALRSELPAVTLRWRDGLVTTHLLTMAAAVLLLPLALRKRSRAGSELLSFASVAIYLLHGAAISGVDQLKVPSVNVFVAYCLGTAVIVALTFRSAVILYLFGVTAFVFSVRHFQPDEAIRLATLPNGGSVSVVCIVLSAVVYAARRRDFLQRVTIEKQREALHTMNVSLEQRVKDQVSEIVAHAEEVDRLNAQLKAQVRERSAELSIALEKLARARPQDALLARGAVLGERFEIHELIAEGGMGAVYAGLDRQTNARVAIKVIQAQSARQLDALRRFLREAGATARVAHPAVVRMLHVDVSDDGMLFHVLELVEGVTLHELLKTGTPWEPKQAARLGAMLCEALAAAHAEGIVHRDVKPGNIMLTHAAPGLKLLDFGISKLFDDPGMADERTATGMVLGTPAYMGPEQSDASQVTARVDIYATGVILFLMLTGQHPFGRSPSGSPSPSPDLARGDSAPSPRSLGSLRVGPSVTIPEPLSLLVRACLERDPLLRPDAKDLARDLAAFADSEGAPALELMGLTVRSAAAASAPPADLVATLADRKRASRPG